MRTRSTAQTSPRQPRWSDVAARLSGLWTSFGRWNLWPADVGDDTEVVAGEYPGERRVAHNVGRSDLADRIGSGVPGTPAERHAPGADEDVVTASVEQVRRWRAGIALEPGVSGAAVAAHGPGVLGRDYARLAALPTDGWPLERVTVDEFARDHRLRLDLVAPMLRQREVDEIGAAIEHLATSSPPCVLTHGDPGSGNYLDHESGGTILDWETASVAPYGIDVGRGAFIALMDNGHTGIPAQLHEAFIGGYRTGASTELAFDAETVHAGTVIASLQFKSFAD